MSEEQKVLADERGFADDYRWSAHEGLFGREIRGSGEASNGATEALAVRQTVDLTVSELHEDCYRLDECVNRDIVGCDSGYTMVGWDRSDCGVSECLVSLSFLLDYLIISMLTFSDTGTFKANLLQERDGSIYMPVAWRWPGL